MKSTQSAKIVFHKALIILLVFTLIFAFTACDKKAIDKKNNDKEDSQKEDTPTNTPPSSPTPEPPPKQLIYISVMGGRDYSLPIEEKGFDYNNADLIVELDPKDQTIKVVDIAWLMGIPIEGEDTLAMMMMMGDRFGPTELPIVIAEALGLTFDNVMIVNFDALEMAIDNLGGVTSDVPKEIIRDGSYNASTDTIKYLAPNIKTPDKLDDAGEMLLTGSQVLAMVFSFPNRIMQATDVSHTVIRLMNTYIRERSVKHKMEYIEVLRKASPNELVTLLKKMQPNMYFTVEEADYHAFAELVALSRGSDPETLRLPEDSEFELEDTDMSTVMICDMEQIKAKLATFFAD
ncbi:MAG: LCP family protein [Clostridiales bacterium]|nr:LCP family protein [Clostridiales bacterium]